MKLDYHRYICGRHRLSHQPQGYNHQYHILDMSQSRLSFFLYIRILYAHSVLLYELHVKHSQVFHWLLDYIRCHQYLEIYILSYQILRLYYSQKRDWHVPISYIPWIFAFFILLISTGTINKQTIIVTKLYHKL